MTALDPLFIALDRGLRRIAGVGDAPVRAARPNPAAAQEADLNPAERRRAAGLMRVNHCGEVCAQALYEGQSATARSAALRGRLRAAAEEERDHLAWCRERLNELDAAPSALDPAFHAASYALGAATGLLGDRVSLGLVEATEDQVQRHLDRHLERLPARDAKSRAILEAMRSDEARHGAEAAQAGALGFPDPVKSLMGLAAKAMTVPTYWI